MIINAYICTDDENVISKNLIFAARFDGTLREPSSILKPSITFEYSGNPTTWTHFGIADFARMYFITDNISVGKNLWQITGRVDVLYTYRGNRVDRDGLYGLTGIVVRNADETDGTLTDTAIPVQNKTDITRIVATVTDIANTWVSSEMIMKNAYQGDDGNKRYCQMLGLPPVSAANLLITSGQPQAFYCLDQTDYMTLVQSQLNQSDAFIGKTWIEYVLTNYWLPFAPNVTGDSIAKLQTPGASPNWDYTGITANIISRGYKILSWKASITADSTYKYKNFPPYRDVFIEFLPFGRIKLDNSVLFSSGAASVDVYFKTVTNVLTGDCVLYYGMTEADANIFLAQSNVRVDLMINANITNFGQIASGLITTVASAAAVYNGNIGAIGGIVGGVQNMLHSTRGESVGGISGKMIDAAPVVLVYDNTTNAAARNNAILGQPLYESRALHTIHGYAEITHVHFDGINATAAEKEELKALLAAGVIFDNETP